MSVDGKKNWQPNPDITPEELDRMTTDVFDRITVARVGLLLKHPFFGNMATRLKIEEASDWLPTAATDGRTIFFNRDFFTPLTTKQIESYISNESGLNLEAFFDQYLRDTRIPTLEYRLKDNILSYRWTQVVNGFEMPIEINFSREKKWLYPTEVWQEIELNSTEIDVDIDYYIKYNKVQ